MNGIEIKNLSFTYNRKEPFLKDIDLNIKSGQIYGLLGKNGAGKTTLLKLISGLRFPQSGDIFIDEFSAKDRNPNFIQDVFYLAEEFYLPAISRKKYINIYKQFYPNFDEEKYEEYIETFKIPKSNRLDKMSYGQKKKFLIAFGLATNTKLFIMDEPTNGLDIPSKSLYRKLLSSTIQENRAYIISTHQIKDVELMLDNVIILDENQIKLDMSISELSEKLYFSKDKTEHQQGDVLYQEDQTLQVSQILSNPNQQDSILDLELLFNAIVSNQPAIINHLKHA